MSVAVVGHDVRTRQASAHPPSWQSPSHAQHAEAARAARGGGAHVRYHLLLRLARSAALGNAPGHVRVRGDDGGGERARVPRGGGDVVLCAKRYSDFVALRAEVAAADAGGVRALPRLPPKVLLGNRSAALIGARAVALCRFLEALAHLEVAAPALERFATVDVLALTCASDAG